MSQFSMESDSVVKEIAEFKCDGSIGDQVKTNIESYLKDSIASAFYDAINSLSFSTNLSDIRSFVNDFFLQYIPSIPDALQKQVGSTSVAGLLPLYLLSRAIDPDMIVESGVFVGSSLHMFSSTFKEIPIYAFDINLNRLRFKPDNVFLDEIDWSEFGSLPRHANSLAFFDDHINCAKRILECQARGIRYAIFDDSPCIGHLAKYRYPAVPSIPMIMDELLPDGCIFEWYHQPTNSKLQYTHDLDLSRSARNVIQKAVCLNLFGGIISAGSGDKWVVELIS